MNIEIAKQRMREVIKTDSVTSSEADFLATHVAFEKIDVINRGQKEKSDNTRTLSEEQIFNEFVINSENIHQFVIVRGDSGAGKSHLIRWFATRLKQLRMEDEEVLFIRRSDNNLKKTIEQLLNLDAVANIKNKGIIERLVKASVMIDDDKFKDMIYQNFIVEIRHDEDTKIFSNLTKKRLEVLLQNTLFHEKLKEIGGPIDRIYAKVSNKEATGNKDLIALFKPEDFEVDIDLLQEMEKQGADKKAQQMANKLYDEPENTADAAKYMNQFVDRVIQNCVGIEQGDIKGVFIEIRQELKKCGKNLTLLIEDITACTGINHELLDVLTTEHTGDYESQELCRLSSFIGTTNEYYKEFRDNFRDRITNQFVIEANQFGHSNESLYEFVGRYLNIMSMSRDKVVTWVEDGCKEAQYPIHEIKQGMGWEQVTIGGKKELSLYPFTKNAIINLYSNLANKTPRYMLSEIVERVLNDVIYNKENFPQFEIRIMPNWNPTTHGQVLSQEIEDSKIMDRMDKFIRVWGEGHIRRTIIGDETYIGGIPTFIYEEFNLPIIKGIVSQETSESKSLSFKNTIGSTASKKVVEPISTSIKPEPISEVKAFSQAEQKYQKEIALVEQWVNGGVFENFENVRNSICNYLVTAINWQEEGVSYDTIIKINNSKRTLISFERQKRNNDSGFLILPSNKETQNIVQAFMAWEILGDKKWQFNGAVYMQYQVALWTEKIKKELVKNILEINDQSVNYFEYACASEIYRLILFGKYKGTTLNSITKELLLDKNIEKELTSNGHSSEWNSLMRMIRTKDQDQENKNVIIHYFNLPQGKIEKTYTSQVFINEKRFKEALASVLKKQLQFEEEALEVEDLLVPRQNIKEYLKKITSRIEKIVVAEKACAQEKNQVIIDYLGDEEILEEDIIELCAEMTEFYKQLNAYQRNYVPKTGEISKIKQAASEIAAAISVMRKGLGLKKELDFLLLFSQDPLSKVQKLIDLLDTVKVDIIAKQRETNKKRAQIGGESLAKRSQESQTDLERSISQYSKIINELEGGKC